MILCCNLLRDYKEMANICKKRLQFYKNDQDPLFLLSSYDHLIEAYYKNGEYSNMLKTFKKMKAFHLNDNGPDKLAQDVKDLYENAVIQFCFDYKEKAEICHEHKKGCQCIRQNKTSCKLAKMTVIIAQLCFWKALAIKHLENDSLKAFMWSQSACFIFAYSLFEKLQSALDQQAKEMAIVRYIFLLLFNSELNILDGAQLNLTMMVSFLCDKEYTKGKGIKFVQMAMHDLKIPLRMLLPMFEYLENEDCKKEDKTKFLVYKNSLLVNHHLKSVLCKWFN